MRVRKYPEGLTTAKVVELYSKKRMTLSAIEEYVRKEYPPGISRSLIDKILNEEEVKKRPQGGDGHDRTYVRPPFSRNRKDAPSPGRISVDFPTTRMIYESVEDDEGDETQ